MISYSASSRKHILITDAGGFISQELAISLLATEPSVHLTLADVFFSPAQDPARATTKIADLTQAWAIDSLLGS